MRLKTENRKPKTPDHGLAALVTVIIIGLLILSIGLTASFLGQTEIISAGDLQRGRFVSDLARTCVDEALQRLKTRLPTAPPSPITVQFGNAANDTCTATITDPGPTGTVCGTSTRTIAALVTSESFGTYKKLICVTARLKCNNVGDVNAAGNAELWTIDSWKEADPGVSTCP